MSKRKLYLDFETTGLKHQHDYPTEIGFILDGGQGVLEEYERYIKLPKGVIVSDFITSLTGVTNQLLDEQGVNIEEVKEKLKEVIDKDTLVIAHNVSFDLGFLYTHFGIEPEQFICTMHMWSDKEPKVSAKLESIYNRNLGKLKQTHQALDDVRMMQGIYTLWEEKYGNELEGYICEVKGLNNRPLLFTPKNAKVIR